MKERFHHTDLSEPITEIALGLTAYKNEEYYPSGTATVVGPYIAITAKHVIDDFYKIFDGKRNENYTKVTFNIFAFQIRDSGKTGAQFEVRKIYFAEQTDIVFLLLLPYSEEAKNFEWRYPKISLICPEIGETINSFGYHTPKIKTIDNTTTWTVNPYSSHGEVKEIYYQQRDSSRLPFPCFETNARFDGSMSGGPVFYEGNLIGIICSNLPPTNEEEEHVSYVSLLWPAMKTEIDINRVGFPQNVSYPFLELNGHFLNIIGAEHLAYLCIIENRSTVLGFMPPMNK